MKNILNDKLYKVRVPMIATYSQEELEAFGLPIGMTEKKIYPVYNELVTIMLTIESMIDIYRKGYKLYLTSQDDINEVYTKIDNYLTGESEVYTGRRFNKRVNEEDEDIRLEIDKFANEIFTYNKPTIVLASIRPDKGIGGRLNLMHTNNVATTPVSNPLESSIKIDDDINYVKNVTMTHEITEVDLSKIQRKKRNTYRTVRRKQ